MFLDLSAVLVVWDSALADKLASALSVMMEIPAPRTFVSWVKPEMVASTLQFNAMMVMLAPMTLAELPVVLTPLLCAMIMILALLTPALVLLLANMLPRFVTIRTHAPPILAMHKAPVSTLLLVALASAKRLLALQ
jgi:hypothetical protein